MMTTITIRGFAVCCHCYYCHEMGEEVVACVLWLSGWKPGVLGFVVCVHNLHALVNPVRCIGWFCLLVTIGCYEMKALTLSTAPSLAVSSSLQGSHTILT
jgi:hypothetical protein